MRKGITHFTSQASAAAIFEGWRRDLVRQDGLTGLGAREVHVRLYSLAGTNDPTEQLMAEYGRDKTSSRDGERSRGTFPDDIFILCGSEPQLGEDGEATNRLDLWRAYGDDGRGVALTTWWDPARLQAEGLEVRTVKYKPDLCAVKSRIKELIGAQGDDTKNRAQREEIRRERMILQAFCKHCDYASEKEVRLARLMGDESGVVRKEGPQEIHIDVSGGRLRPYIEWPVGLGTALTRIDVTFGPRMARANAQNWEKLVQWMTAQMGLSGGRVAQSRLQYIG